MDDRFDLHLFSATMVDGAGLAVIPGTYRALGNDGLHWNKAINDGNNFYFPGQLARSNALANALFDASDHVPVVVDLQLPAVMEAWIPAQPGRVIRLASVSVEVRAWNAVSVVTPLGVDPLQFGATATGAVSGSASGTAPIEPSFASRTFPLNTSVVGVISGMVTVSSPNEAVKNPVLPLPVTGRVLRPSNASFAPSADVDATVANFEVTADSGVALLEVPIHNPGFDINQALLDVDGASLAAGPAGFSIVEATAFGLGSAPGIVRFGFDTTGAAPGIQERGATIFVSDEDIPGASSGTLSVTLRMTIGGKVLPGDLNGDGIVNGADLGALLGYWGLCPAPCPGDFDGNGVVDGADLGILLGNWS